MLQRLQQAAHSIQLDEPELEGSVAGVQGLLIEASYHRAAIGDELLIRGPNRDVRAEVVGFREGSALLMPFGDLHGIAAGQRIQKAPKGATIGVGARMLGRVVDAFGTPIDDGPGIVAEAHMPLRAAAVPPMQRDIECTRLTTGLRVLDAFIPVAHGQRLGIFAGAGVGKSVMLGELTRNCSADIVVLGLVGERGREVGHFVRSVLGDAGLERSVVVAATSDRPAHERVRAALTATAVAEFFRDSGANVMLFVDSLTRFAMAQREIGLAVGEPPTAKGYPPSTFAMLPRLLERAGSKRGAGSITAFYTVLLEGDELTDPVGDAARGLLDGHIVLSRELASRGQFPAVDVLQSISRLASELHTATEKTQTQRVRTWLATLERARDLLSLGGYQPGADPELDQALSKQNALEAFLAQPVGESSGLDETRDGLAALTRGGH